MTHLVLSGVRPSFNEAISIVVDRIRPVLPERLALSDALGTCLAETVRARVDSPRFRASAMDGFAIPTSATFAATEHAPIDIKIGAAIYAGDIATREDELLARPISTGARIPKGLDAVVTREAAERASKGASYLRFRAVVRSGLNIRNRGEDAHVGETVAHSGQSITPATIGALASYGISSVIVRRAPAIALFPTGSELSNGDDGRGPSTIIDSNGPMIEACARQLGLDVRRVPPVADFLSLLRDQLDTLMSAPRPQIILSTGGVSVGDRDLIRAMLLDRGADIHFHGVAMRPGKPVLFATLPGGGAYFGLPGNPVAALVGFRFLVLAAIRTAMGLPVEQGEAVVIDYPGRPDTTVFAKVRADLDLHGNRVIEVLSRQQSHMLRPLLRANAWVKVEDRSGFRSTLLYPALPTLMC